KFYHRDDLGERRASDSRRGVSGAGSCGGTGRRVYPSWKSARYSRRDCARTLARATCARVGSRDSWTDRLAPDGGQPSVAKPASLRALEGCAADSAPVPLATSRQQGRHSSASAERRQPSQQPPRNRRQDHSQLRILGLNKAMLHLSETELRFLVETV